MHKYKTLFIDNKLQWKLLIMFLKAAVSKRSSRTKAFIIWEMFFMQSLLMPHFESELMMSLGKLGIQKDARDSPPLEMAYTAL